MRLADLPDPDASAAVEQALGHVLPEPVFVNMLEVRVEELDPEVVVVHEE
jgi:hypothetical protein